jgi:hypothetical protein
MPAMVLVTEPLLTSHRRSHLQQITQHSTEKHHQTRQQQQRHNNQQRKHTTKQFCNLSIWIEEQSFDKLLCVGTAGIRTATRLRLGACSSNITVHENEGTVMSSNSPGSEENASKKRLPDAAENPSNLGSVDFVFPDLNILLSGS